MTFYKPPVATILFAAGIIIAHTLHLVIPIPRIILGAGALIAISLLPRSPHIILLFFLLGAGVYATREAAYLRGIKDIDVDTSQETTLRFHSPPLYRGEYRYGQIVRTSFGNIHLPSIQKPLTPGEERTVSLTLTPPQSTSSYPWGFNEKKFFRSRNIVARGEIERSIDQNKNHLSTLYQYIRHRIEALSVAHRDYYAAVLLRQRYRLPEKVEELFTTYGIMHITAISGLHIGMLLITIATILSPLPLPRSIVRTLALIILGTFVPLVGVSAATLRALTMAAVYLGAPLVGRVAHPLSTLSIAALILLWIDPIQLFQAGFHLSFGATAAIIIAAQRILRVLPSHLRSLGGFLCIPPVITLVTWPITAYHFQSISPAGIWANILLLPQLTLTLQLFILSLIITPLWTNMGILLQSIATHSDANTLNLMKYLSDTLSLSQLPLSIGLTTALIWTALYGAIGTSGTLRKLCICLALLLATIHIYAPGSEANSYHFTKERGSTYISPGKNLIILTGTSARQIHRDRFWEWVQQGATHDITLVVEQEPTKLENIQQTLEQKFPGKYRLYSLSKNEKPTDTPLRLFSPQWNIRTATGRIRFTKNDTGGVHHIIQKDLLKTSEPRGVSQKILQ
ncbi:DNA internalization-related competence protein ComEC/Rec2 [Chitinivibrio alkaliphilus ACht1]|uniref:DNA internalization-related competence protein ComEC/Rec2 n=1 Tax=Chitinivibrio alkaliphilus ACht1 TaxID=1313304 RepID=U7D971_9BACT|nr:DNA internalization-related competence protein ComEC/Rec2 [Chitinivibrio alkaliphilus ACht1]